MARGSAGARLTVAALSWLAAAGLWQCGSDSEEMACEPGLRTTCICPNGARGTRICGVDGSGFSRCVCDDAGVDVEAGRDATTGSGGSATSGSGGSLATGGSTSTGGGAGVDGSVGGFGGVAGAAGSGGSTELDGSVSCPTGSATNVTSGDCDLVLQNCGGGLTCRVAYTDAGTPRAACLDLGDGPRDLGAACTSHSECRAGLSCVLNKCTRPCCVDYEAAICGTGDCDMTVTFSGGAFTRVCTFSPPCTPWTNDCPPGAETDCHLSGTSLQCSLPRYAADAGPTIGTSCVYTNDCGDSQFCLYPTSGATSGNCRWLCKVADSGAPDAGTVGGSPGQGGCEAGETCLAFTQPSWLGVCQP